MREADQDARAQLLRIGDAVVFVDRQGREYPAVLAPSEVSNIRGNLLPHDRIIGQPEGLRVRGSQAVVFWVVRSTLAQFTLAMPRHAAIIYPKDVALLVAYADVFPGAAVVEGGYDHV